MTAPKMGDRNFDGGYKRRFIVFEGMDNCGKSTQIQRVLNSYKDAIELKFPKTLPSGALLRMNTEKDFEMLFTLFHHLDGSKVYLLDRFIPSNIVYDSVLRGESAGLSHEYWERFKSEFDVITIILTRPEIKSDFVDDRIKMTKDQFNQALHVYRQLGTNYQLLDRDENDQPSGVRFAEQMFIEESIKWIFNEL
jgi:thymidylate kinase